MGYTSFSNLPLSAYNELSSKVEDRVYFINDEGTIRLNEVTYGETPELSSLVPSGGTVGQVLTKTADGSEWADSQGGEINGTNYFWLRSSVIWSSFKIKLESYANPGTLNLEYSTDRINWTTWLSNQTAEEAAELTIGGNLVLYLRGNNPNGTNPSNESVSFNRFVITSSTGVYSGGDLTTLMSPLGNVTFFPSYCFNYLFYSNGGALLTIPALPKGSALSCPFNRTFSYNSNIEEAIIGNVERVLTDSVIYYETFWGCSKLKKVNVEFTTWGGTNGNVDWLRNVAASGTFYCPYGLDTSIRDAFHIPVGWDLVYTSVPESVLSGAAAAAEALTMING